MIKSRFLSGTPKDVNDKMKPLFEEGWRVAHMHSYGYPVITDNFRSAVHVVSVILEKEDSEG